MRNRAVAITVLLGVTALVALAAWHYRGEEAEREPAPIRQDESGSPAGGTTTAEGDPTNASVDQYPPRDPPRGHGDPAPPPLAGEGGDPPDPSQLASALLESAFNAARLLVDLALREGAAAALEYVKSALREEPSGLTGRIRQDMLVRSLPTLVELDAKIQDSVATELLRILGSRALRVNLRMQAMGALCGVPVETFGVIWGEGASGYHYDIHRGQADLLLLVPLPGTNGTEVAPFQSRFDTRPYRETLLPLILETLRFDSNTEIRTAAAAALTEISGKEAAVELNSIALSEEEPSGLRAEAIHGLLSISPDAARTAILRGLESRSWWMQEQALERLSRVATWSEETRGIVVARLTSEHDEVRSAAVSAMADFYIASRDPLLQRDFEEILVGLTAADRRSASLAQHALSIVVVRGLSEFRPLLSTLEPHVRDAQAKRALTRYLERN